MGPITVRLGNESAKEGFRASREAPLQTRTIEGHRVTTVHIPVGRSLAAAFRDITDPAGVWAAHSTGANPVWIESSDPDLEKLLRSHYGVGDRPAGWEEDA